MNRETALLNLLRDCTRILYKAPMKKLDKIAEKGGRIKKNLMSWL